jgi:hypothetical protein
MASSARIGSAPSRSMRLIAVLALSAVSWAGAAWAGWSFDPQIDTSVCDTLGNQTQTVTATDGAGGVIAAWIDTRFGAADVYAQRLTANGEVAPGWLLEGLPVCRASSLQTGVRIIADGAGGAILAWIDFRAGSADLYAQRVTGAGTIASGWTGNGVAVCTAAGSQSDIVLCGDGAQGAVFAWQDSRTGTHKDIYALRLLASGERHASWPANGRLVCGAPGDQFFPAIVANGSGASLLAWQDARNTESDIFAQSIDGNGAPIWSSGGVLVSAGTGTQEKPRIVADGAGGAYVCWTDYREVPAVAVYLQHLTASGKMAPFWMFDGMAVAPPGSSQSEGAMLADGAGGVFVAWVDTRNGTKDVFLNRLDGFGGVPPGWIEGGMPVCAAEESQISPALAPDGAGGVMVAWRDARNDSQYDVFGTRIAGDGSIAPSWIADGLPFGNAHGSQADLSLVPSIQGAAIATWSDFRNDAHWDVYANRLGPDVILDAPESPVAAPLALVVAPHPMVDEATIAFTLSRPGRARLTIHDVAGRRVRVLLDASVAAGSQRVRWDGRDESGRRVASGVYVIACETHGARSTRTLIKR